MTIVRSSQEHLPVRGGRLRIINVTAGSSYNWGDALLERVGAGLLELQGAEVISRPLVAGMRPASGSGGRRRTSLSLGRIARRALPDLLRARLRHWIGSRSLPSELGCVFIGGGQLLLPSYQLSLNSWVRWADARGVPVVLFGVGGEGVYKGRALSLFRDTLSRCAAVYVRDDLTRQIIKEVGSPVEPHLVPDVVYALRRVMDVVPTHEPRCLLVPADFDTIKRYRTADVSEDGYVDWWADKARGERLRGNTVSVIGSTKEDARMARRIVEACDRAGLTDVHAVDIQSVDDFVGEIGRSSKVVSARMHPLIVAQQFGIEAEPFLRNEKLIHYWRLRSDAAHARAQLVDEVTSSIESALRSCGITRASLS